MTLMMMKTPSKERVASRFLTAVRKQFWHGTSSKYVRSILKQGLIPVTKEKQYEGESGERGGYISKETFGGIYVTDDFFTANEHARNAARKTGGNPLFVGMTLETRSPSALPDEDDVLPAISMAVNTSTGYDLTRPQSFWNKLFRSKKLEDSRGNLEPDFPQLVKVIQEANLTKPIKTFFDKGIRQAPRLKRRYEIQKKELDALLETALKAHAIYLLSLYHKEEVHSKLEVASLLLESESEEYQKVIRQWKTTVPPELKQNPFQKMVKAVTKLSESIREVLDTGGRRGLQRHNARFMSPITYRGKNRIQLVAETIYRESKSVQGPPHYTDIVFHYLQPSNLMNEFLSLVESERPNNIFSYRVFYKGKVVKHKILNDYSEWPEDLWGPQ